MTRHQAAEPDERVARWLAAIEARHLADLRFPEVTQALRALSSAYVERRGRLARGAALDGAGKRAAFALFYGPLHFLTIRHIVGVVDGARPPLDEVFDVGCGTGVAGAAWALGQAAGVRVSGVDLHPWAVDEARWTCATLSLATGRISRADGSRAALPRPPVGIVAAFTLNELDDERRAALLSRLLGAARAGARVLVVEPIARGASPWWNEASQAVRGAGGRDDEWRLRLPLPDIVARLDRAAGLRHGEITARSLYLPGDPRGGTADEPVTGLRPEETEM